MGLSNEELSKYCDTENNLSEILDATEFKHPRKSYLLRANEIIQGWFVTRSFWNLMAALGDNLLLRGNGRGGI